MTHAVALVGWATAAIAMAAAAVLRHSLRTGRRAVARACHELRGPLSAIRLGVELGVRSGRLSEAALHAIDLEVGRATVALDDLAWTRRRRVPTVTRIRARRMGPREHVDVASLLAASVEAWRATAVASGVELRMRWSGGAAVVLGERLRLAQATGNLLANAIEHGGGTVEVRGYADPSRVRIEVLDSGPGLTAPVAELARRAAKRRARLNRGHGLAIASAVAAAHGGRLAAAPSDRGARLVLELPVARPTAAGFSPREA
jgi:signal transduction histidine kinase